MFLIKNNITRYLFCIFITGIAVSCRAQKAGTAGLYQVAPAKTNAVFRHDTYIAFDSKNNSYSFDMSAKQNYGYLFVNENGVTRKVNLLTAIAALYPKTPEPTDTLFHALGSVTVDKKDRVYLIYYFYYPFNEGLKKWKARIPLLLYSADYGHHFKAYKFAGDPDLVFLEKKSPFETNDYPPLIGYTKSTNQKVSPMADMNEFGIFEPEIASTGELTNLRQQLITHYSPGISNHTGGESFAATFNNTTAIAYNEIPEKKDGNNIIILNYNRQTHTFANQQRIPLIINSKYPYPDAHVTPVIVTLKNGQQHVIVGPQAGDYYDFTRNINNAATDTFTRIAVLQGPRVYASALRDKDDNIYLYFSAYKPKPGLYFQKFDSQLNAWGNEKLLVAPPKDFSARTKDNYGVYYFKPAIDMNNKLYLSFTFWNTYSKEMYPRFLFQSSDKGKKWKLNN